MRHVKRLMLSHCGENQRCVYPRFASSRSCPARVRSRGRPPSCLANAGPHRVEVDRREAPGPRSSRRHSHVESQNLAQFVLDLRHRAFEAAEVLLVCGHHWSRLRP